MKPKHVDVADFLQEVSTEEGTGYLEPGVKHWTTDDLVKAYIASDMYEDVVRILADQEVNILVSSSVHINHVAFLISNCHFEYRHYFLEIHFQPNTLLYGSL